MKKLFVLCAIAVALMAAGVIHFQKDGDEYNISIDRKRLREVSGKMVDEGKQLIDEAKDEFDSRRGRSASRYDDFEDNVRDFESNVREQARRFTPERGR